MGSENSKTISLRGYLLAKTGRVEEAREVTRALEALAKTGYIPACAIAQVYSGLDEVDEAFRWLERAIEEHDVHLATLPSDSKWDALRADRRFADVLRRCGLPYGELTG